MVPTQLSMWVRTSYGVIMTPIVADEIGPHSAAHDAGGSGATRTECSLHGMC